MAEEPKKPEDNNKPENGTEPSGFASYDTDTQFDMEAMPGNEKTSSVSDKPKRRKTPQKTSQPLDPNATDEFSFDQFDENENEDELPEITPEEEEPSKDKKFHRPTSILDLIKGKDQALPIVDYEEDSDLDQRLEGKTLDDVLKSSRKAKHEWHESEKAKESEIERAAAKKSRHRKLIIFTPIIFIFTGILCFYIVLPALGPPPEAGPIKLPKRQRKVETPESLKIDPKLKDPDKLEKYFNLAEKLFSEKKYDKSEIVYKKLLPTGWRAELLFARIGQCRDYLKDPKGAVEFYTKALKAGFGSDVEIPLRLGALLKEQNKYQEIYDILSPLQERFANTIQFQSLLADTYWKLKMPAETMSTLRSINKQFLNKDQLQIYSDLLMHEGDQREAFNVYLFLAQNFNDVNSFIKAAEIAPNPKLKIAVLTELIGKTIGQPESNYYNLLLGECMLSQGKKKDALRVLEKIKADKLAGDHALRFLKLVGNFDTSKSLIDSCEALLTKNYINNLPVQEEIRDILLNANKRDLAEQVFSQQVVKFPHSPIANYMFATVAPSLKLKEKYYNSALDANPKFFSASLALGKLYADDGRLEDAITRFNQCIVINPSSNAARYWLAIVKIRQTQNTSALEEYQAFLKKKGLKETTILKQMVLLAQYLPTSTEAMKYIQEMEKIPELKDFRQLQTIRTKMMYGTLKDSDFTGLTDPDIKKYRVIFLLGEGKVKEVMMLPTLKSEFPDYWKVFLCWRNNISSWRGNSQLLIFKHPTDPLIVMSAKLWLWEMSPSEAESQVNRLKYEDIPILYLMIAERYRKDNNKVKASIAYLTAMRYRQPNLYCKVVEYFKDH